MTHNPEVGGSNPPPLLLVNKGLALNRESFFYWKNAKLYIKLYITVLAQYCMYTKTTIYSKYHGYEGTPWRFDEIGHFPVFCSVEVDF